MNTTMAKDVSASTDMPESMVSVKSVNQTTPPNHQLLEPVPLFLLWSMVNVFASQDIPRWMESVSKPANVEPTVTITDLASAFVTLASTKQLTEAVSPVLHAHHQVQEMTRENAFVTLVSPSMPTIALNAHSEPSSITPPKSVSTFVDKTQPTMLPNKSASA